MKMIVRKNRVVNSDPYPEELETKKKKIMNLNNGK